MKELVNLLNKSDQLTFSLSPLFTAIVAFCFSMTIGIIWELFEFGMDQIFALDMQKDKDEIHRKVVIEYRLFIIGVPLAP